MPRAKFHINSVEHHDNYGSPDTVIFTVNASPVGDGDPEGFNKYTPSGELRMGITNPNLKDYFVPGKDYYLDFTLADTE